MEKVMKNMKLLIGLVLTIVLVVSLRGFAQVGEEVERVEGVEVRIGEEGGSLRVNWEEVEDGDVVGYKIYYGQNKVSEGVDWYEGVEEVSGGGVTEYILEGLEIGKIYYVVMTAVDEEGNESMDFSRQVAAVVKEGGINFVEEEFVPVAVIGVDENEGVAPMGVTFDATGSSYAGGGELFYGWDMDGDGGVDLEGGLVEYVFEESGVYEVSLFVVTEDGKEAMERVEIIVREGDSSEFDSEGGQSFSEMMEGVEVGKEDEEVVEYFEVEVRDLNLNYEEMKDSYVVRLDWELGDDPNGEVVEYAVYMRGEVGAEERVGLVAEEGWGGGDYEIRGIKPGEDYIFRVVAVSAEGLESEGMELEVNLPDLFDTGMGFGMFVGLGILVWLGLGAWRRRVTA